MERLVESLRGCGRVCMCMVKPQIWGFTWVFSGQEWWWTDIVSIHRPDWKGLPPEIKDMACELTYLVMGESIGVGSPRCSDSTLPSSSNSAKLSSKVLPCEREPWNQPRRIAHWSGVCPSSQTFHCSYTTHTLQWTMLRAIQTCSQRTKSSCLLPHHTSNWLSEFLYM